jgi:hypothetical protein
MYHMGEISSRRKFLKLGIASAASLAAERVWPRSLVPDSQSSGQTANRPRVRKNSVGVSGDRWMEIDLYWFAPASITEDVRRFWDRFEQLYDEVQGYRGLILAVGGTINYVMEWAGDLEQHITLPNPLLHSTQNAYPVLKYPGLQHWVKESSQLTGNANERMRKWKQRFQQPLAVKHRGDEHRRYGDLKTAVFALKQEAARRGVGDFPVGMANAACMDFYGILAPRAARHPEAFKAPPPPKGGETFKQNYLVPAAKLHADHDRLAAFPSGLPEGILARQAYAQQWGKLSQAVALDALMLRDMFGMPVGFHRGGPFGRVAPSPAAIRSWTDDVAALVWETKKANPKALLMMYSNAASAVGDWRCNGLDLESIAKEGYLDIFVDQTWAGAWNEVAVREASFWNIPTLGWTYQLCNMLLHGAILADTRVRHYPLVETFDAWEEDDVIHTAPERLRWGIWAYSHAAVKTPSGIKMPAGSYISWANQGERLLEEQDVQFLRNHLAAALTDTAETTEALGPTLVYSREAMLWQAQHAQPDQDVKEWIDEQAGSVIKWPVPVLSSTRMEWLSGITSDLPILQAPSHLGENELKFLTELIRSGKPVAIFGSPSGGIDPLLQQLVGLKSLSNTQTVPRPQNAQVSESASKFVENIPAKFGTLHGLSVNETTSGALVLYSVEGSPVLVLNLSDDMKALAWDPPEVMFKDNFSLMDNWAGGGGAFALTAGALNFLLKNANALHVESVDINQWVTVAAWRTEGDRLRIMAANLEEGLRYDADLSRHTTLVLPNSWHSRNWLDLWSKGTVMASNGRLPINLGQAATMLLEPLQVTRTRRSVAHRSAQS